MARDKRTYTSPANNESINKYLDESALSRVMYFLPFRERVKCERVCKVWRKCALEVSNSRQTSLSIMGEKVNKNMNQNFCATPAHRVSKLYDIVERTDSSVNLLSILSRVPNLKALHLKADDTSPVITSEEAKEIPKLLPQIEHFSFCDDKMGWNIYDDLVDVIAEMANLIHLEFKFPVKEGTSKSELLQENMIFKDILVLTKENLEVLSCNIPISLSNCKALANGCTKLRKLSMIGGGIAANGLRSLMEDGSRRGRYLRSLNISVDSQEQLKTISANMLCLHSLYCVIDDKVDIDDIGVIGQLKNLSNLFLSCWTNDLLDNGLSKIFFGCRDLTSLIINGECSDRSFERLSDFCEDMRRIEINNGKEGSQITERTMYAFTKLRNLKSLTIYSSNFSDASVEAMLQNCLKLNTLCIRRNANLTKSILPVCIDFASNKKTKEKVYFTLPKQLRDVWPMYLEYSVPPNLIMKFEN